MAISEPFAKVLSAGRAQFNQRVTEARRRYPAFDTGAFADFLQTGIDKLVVAVADFAPERVSTTVLVAYDMALELVGQALAGPKARSPLVNRVWQEILPAYPRLVTAHPVEVLGAMSNAAVNIGKVGNARPDQWIREMGALASQVESLPQLQALGQVLAWRCGVAHFRLGAIQAADLLPEQFALAALGSSGGASWSDVKDKLLADPWWTPGPIQGSAVHPGIEVGRFTGFGGEFDEPPEVRACPEGFFVKSAERYSFLVADAFGAVLHAASREEFDHAKAHSFPKAVVLSRNRLVVGKREIDLDLPEGHISIAHNTHTVAVTSPFTHAIRLLPLQ
ncbi:hypothetical protein EDC30_110100 [Paucimonas lemoignei]|uniref:Uncharacterized protein n=1 Tax=Paucimonas lemoignei TaxID=29443 RepID=A0A4R3HU10_PAULE|nr:hypothetical protein [Paucimonas lemoignei]TCS35631.1 hypothetical protein EDC30_110100 [Paucimonas lemoignei]